MAAEPPLRVERREELVWLLVQAAELEHGLMCEYLSLYVLPHRQAAWRILAERLEELADRAERLSQTTGLGPLTTLHGVGVVALPGDVADQEAGDADDVVNMARSNLRNLPRP